MAKLAILHFPDPRLRRQAHPVAAVDARIRRLADDMLETMYDSNGVGLAATQVAVSERVVVIDVSESRDRPMVLINPEIVEGDGESENEEGCLSVPGFFEPVKRLARVRARALDVDGEPFELEADGLLAICIQHEIDHINGKLFVDHISELKRTRIRKRLEKAKRHQVGAPPRRADRPVI